MNKKDLSERDICTKFITPALKSAGWDIHRQIREEVSITAGRIIVRGKMSTRGKAKRADYVLYYKPNIPVAVIEAKDNTHSVADGMQQALEYAEMLDVPFVYSSNGDGFLEHDGNRTSGEIEIQLPLDSFPAPDRLWTRYRVWKGIGENQQAIVAQDYFDDGSGKQPRYYQVNAVNRAIEAIARGQNRILLVMATGTGKTYTAFQIIWRLWKSFTKKRILFLADRNILVDQTKTNDFKPLGGAMTKVTNRTVDKSYEIYLSLYQAVSGAEEHRNIYKQFSRDFFDLVIVDECHRGSAADDSAWREILEYFSPATQIGMTATPKETNEVSNILYFGEPVYTYSLKQGIQDGFLAPYKVIRVHIDKDVLGWRPEAGKVDKQGYEIDDRIYNVTDMDRNLVIEKRTSLVAKKISEYLRAIDRYAKTIIFCEDIDHAERMRQAIVNENADIAGQERRYVMRITGDNELGKMELDNFIDPESVYPVIATTSKLLSTGVDAQTCKLIVLDQTIRSMTEFKQIIGRGTRINEDYGKMWFTIMDFKDATKLFADPAFDGEPVQIYEPAEGDPAEPPENLEPGDYDPETSPEPLVPEPDTPEGARPMKYIVDDVPVYVLAEQVQYYGKDGKLITESLRDYTRKVVGKEFESLGDFLTRWTEADRKQSVVDALAEEGVLFDEIAEEVRKKSGKELDPFDLICHVVFDQPPLTRRERADQVRKRNYFTQYGDQARAVLDVLLDKYADEGLENLEDIKVLKVPPLNELGTPVELVKRFGGKNGFLSAVKALEGELYRVA